ncbi:MAG TPA: biotin--[acetyl-CoA-carboxylase] ligase [Candidatus Limnocylindria bacterium]|jgi:BirA family biotin operon repressor/biotin-[acetyl-CoA-carboxylase] ligase|nr:biotin--[acetyl-CoA-carboxylase] ligase [Candidatus Limnocylindria bacterium]
MSSDTKILSAMRASGTSGVSGAELARQLGVSRAAVWARIEELRKVGYDIAASPHHGYVLRATPDLLHADDLLSRLGSIKVIGRDVRVFGETSSTNDVVEKLARDGAAEGITVFAETQTKGRGRLGRKWVSPPGKGLWFSVLLRPDLRPQSATQLTVISAVAVARAIEKQTGLKPGIKWPNDIMFGARKCAGILLELSAELDHIRHVVLGIGIDVNLTAEELPPELRAIATSLRMEAGHPIDRPELAAAVIRELDAAYARLRAGDFHEIGDEWMRRCITLGQRVRILIGDRPVAGMAEALDEEGALLIRTEHGRLERVVGGDVMLEK